MALRYSDGLEYHGADDLGLSELRGLYQFEDLGCGGGLFDCDHVLHSKWSTMLGLPVAAWAAVLYLSVLAALIVTAKAAVSPQPTAVRSWTWSIVTAAGVSAGLAALWFIGLQVFVLEHLCPWCLAAHTCGILLCLATLVMSPLAGKVKALCAAAGFSGTLGLVVIQLLTPAPLVSPSKNSHPYQLTALPSKMRKCLMHPEKARRSFPCTDAQARLQVRPASWGSQSVARAGAIFSLLATPQDDARQPGGRRKERRGQAQPTCSSN